MDDTTDLFAKLFEKEIQKAVAEAVHNPPQLSRDDLAGMTYEQINEARKAGQLNDILFGRS